jgi:hypothetical protein
MIKSRTQTEQSSGGIAVAVAVVVAVDVVDGKCPATATATCTTTTFCGYRGIREAPGGWWGGLSVPKPPKGVAVAVSVPAS